MKNFLSLFALLTVAVSLQSCVAYVYGPSYGPGWHWHHRPYGPAMTADAADATHTAPVADTSDSALAEHYGISVHSAQMIADLAAGKNTSTVLKAAGVSEADLAPLKKQQMPSDETIQTIAENLGESSTTITTIFSDFIADTKAGN